MTILKEIRKHVCSVDQNMFAGGVHNLGQKVMNTAHVLGRKSVTRCIKSKTSGVMLPVVCTITSMAGSPEFSGAIASASNGFKRIINA